MSFSTRGNTRRGQSRNTGGSTFSSRRGSRDQGDSDGQRQGTDRSSNRTQNWGSGFRSHDDTRSDIRGRKKKNKHRSHRGSGRADDTRSDTRGSTRNDGNRRGHERKTTNNGDNEAFKWDKLSNRAGGNAKGKWDFGGFKTKSNKNRKQEDPGNPFEQVENMKGLVFSSDMGSNEIVKGRVATDASNFNDYPKAKVVSSIDIERQLRADKDKAKLDEERRLQKYSNVNTKDINVRDSDERMNEYRRVGGLGSRMNMPTKNDEAEEENEEEDDEEEDDEEEEEEDVGDSNGDIVNYNNNNSNDNNNNRVTMPSNSRQCERKSNPNHGKLSNDQNYSMNRTNMSYVDSRIHSGSNQEVEVDDGESSSEYDSSSEEEPDNVPRQAYLGHPNVQYSENARMQEYKNIGRTQSNQNRSSNMGNPGSNKNRYVNNAGWNSNRPNNTNGYGPRGNNQHSHGNNNRQRPNNMNNYGPRGTNQHNQHNHGNNNMQRNNNDGNTNNYERGRDEKNYNTGRSNGETAYDARHILQSNFDGINMEINDDLIRRTDDTVAMCVRECTKEALRIGGEVRSQREVLMLRAIRDLVNITMLININPGSDPWSYRRYQSDDLNRMLADYQRNEGPNYDYNNSSGSGRNSSMRNREQHEEFNNNRSNGWEEKHYDESSSRFLVQTPQDGNGRSSMGTIISTGGAVARSPIKLSLSDKDQRTYNDYIKTIVENAMTIIHEIYCTNRSKPSLCLLIRILPEFNTFLKSFSKNDMFKHELCKVIASGTMNNIIMNFKGVDPEQFRDSVALYDSNNVTKLIMLVLRYALGKISIVYKNYISPEFRAALMTAARKGMVFEASDMHRYVDDVNESVNLELLSNSKQRGELKRIVTACDDPCMPTIVAHIKGWHGRLTPDFDSVSRAITTCNERDMVMVFGDDAKTFYNYRNYVHGMLAKYKTKMMREHKGGNTELGRRFLAVIAPTGDNF